MMDTLIEHFAGEYRKRLGQETPSEHANYDYHSGIYIWDQLGDWGLLGRYFLEILRSTLRTHFIE